MNTDLTQVLLQAAILWVLLCVYGRLTDER